MPQQGDSLHGKVAIVTGGSSGIGLSLCCRLAAEGASVVIVGRSRERLLKAREVVVGASGMETVGQARVLPYVADVRFEDEMAGMVETTLCSLGRVDILIAAAGMLRPVDSRPDLLVHLSEKEFSKILDTNLKGVFLSNRAVLKTMIAQHSGHIINVSSLSGKKALPLDAAYCASKFGVRGLSEALAEEVAQYNIRVHCVLPGNTETPIWNQNRVLPKSPNMIPADRITDTVLLLLQKDDVVIGQDVSISPAKLLYTDFQQRTEHTTS